MTQDGITFISWFFREFWRFFNSWYIPGTAISPAGALFGFIAIPLALKFILSVANGISINTRSEINRYKEKGGK